MRFGFPALTAEFGRGSNFALQTVEFRDEGFTPVRPVIEKPQPLRKPKAVGTHGAGDQFAKASNFPKYGWQWC